MTLEQIIADSKPDEIYNLGAMSHVKGERSEPHKHRRLLRPPSRPLAVRHTPSTDMLSQYPSR